MYISLLTCKPVLQAAQRIVHYFVIEDIEVKSAVRLALLFLLTEGHRYTLSQAPSGEVIRARNTRAPLFIETLSYPLNEAIESRNK